MKPHKKFTILPNIFLVLTFVFMTVQPAASAKETTETAVEEIFEYQIESRTDPFMSFIKEQQPVSQVNMDEIVSPDESLLTGMQLFEPDQLKIVGLMAFGRNKMAMVQDLIGQGYTIEIGTLVGKRGVVKDITPKGVIIEETAVTRSGKKKITEIMMTLKPEGEK